ncbi:MAG: DUF305 domain-containing protein [Rhodococcus sp.]|nr:DUF305 domain-containing protein [Rhodococcus sp. (in: high G+C Gram-positive bacteria)]
MRSNRSTRIKIAFAAGSAAAALVVAGCSDGNGDDMTDAGQASSATSAVASAEGETESADSSTAHNQADVAFLQMMYPHHEQAVEMAAMVDGRTTNEQIIDLASEIEAAQGPEMEQMTALLEQFGEPAPTGTGHSMDMDHGGGHGEDGGMSGMMSEGEMTELANMSGAEFDTMWLEMMIVHHQGAIDMAETELAAGENTEAKDMANAIVDVQQSEITTMQDLLQG